MDLPSPFYRREHWAFRARYVLILTQGSRDAVQTGAALLLLSWGLQATEALLASSAVTGEEPHIWSLRGAAPLLAILVALGHLLCP